MKETQDGGEVRAYFEAAPVTLRVVGYPSEDGWTEEVQIVAPHSGSVMSEGRVVEGDADVITVHEGFGLDVSSFYNALLRPFVRRELQAAREHHEEAKAQGDAINFHSSGEYIEELEETLEEIGGSP